MLKKNLVIGVGGVISLLIFMIVAGVLILALTGAPATEKAKAPSNSMQIE